mgnify:CR=1 FL=1
MFTGFTDETVDFMWGIRFNNERGWFLEHKQQYQTQLLEPTRVYARDILAMIAAAQVHAISHITGGGLANNLVRVLPDGIAVTIDRRTWTPPPIFGLVQSVGQVSQADIEATLNQGVGMALVLPPESVDAVRRVAAARGIDSWVAGHASASNAPASVTLQGDHPQG